jgi:tetratricopeptide (TPR) repeat protein
MQGQLRAAIQHLTRVLEISQEMDDHVGDADACGTIADVYTELGQFDTAAQYYDKYIERMTTDGPV